jgi:hypothetical protein
LPAGRESRKAELRPELVEMEVGSVLKIVGVVWSEHLKLNSLGGELCFCCLMVIREPAAYFHDAKQRDIWSKSGGQGDEVCDVR